MGKYETAFSKRQILFNRGHLESDSESLSSFKDDLAKHLSTTIFVKDHRYKYQKEQFDRLMFAMSDIDLRYSNNTLKDYCFKYAKYIEQSTCTSHGFKHHKIAANYTDD